MYPSSPASHHPSIPSHPPSRCWPAPLHASQGRFLPQLGVLGCVAACLYWSVDFLVAACTYLNIPRPLLCVPGLAQPPSLLPLLLFFHQLLHPHPAYFALSHTPSFCFITPSLLRSLIIPTLSILPSSYPSSLFCTLYSYFQLGFILPAI